MKSARLRTRLSAANVLTVFVTVALISIVANFFIERQFQQYIATQQTQKARDIVAGLTQQYDLTTKRWHGEMVHAIGMNALYEGYVISVYDEQERLLWDAETCDMDTCRRVMADITARMQSQYPRGEGQFAPKEFSLISAGSFVGKVRINLFGPYFLNENDLFFLRALNGVLLGVGAVSLCISVLIGFLLAVRLSRPIQKAVRAVGLMAGGQYQTRLEGRTGTRELDELTLSVNHLAQSIESQEALRKRLTADVAHELRTPLTTLQTHTEAMVLGLWQPTPERLKSNLEEILHVSKIVSDLESLTKAESGALELDLESVDLSQLLESAVQTFEAPIEQKRLTVSFEGRVAPVMADQDRMRQVALNLLSNAIKYTPEQGRIVIGQTESKDTITFFVENTGEGIPTEALPHIFERFYRADQSRNRKTGGTGIGLTIAQSIIQAHGGTIAAQNVPHQGSRFTVNIPKRR